MLHQKVMQFILGALNRDQDNPLFKELVLENKLIKFLKECVFEGKKLGPSVGYLGMIHQLAETVKALKKKKERLFEKVRLTNQTLTGKNYLKSWTLYSLFKTLREQIYSGRPSEETQGKISTVCC